MKSAVTICLVPEARSGPFVFHDGLDDGIGRAAKCGFDAVEIFPPSAAELDVPAIRGLCQRHKLQVAALGTGAGWVKHKLRLTDADPAVREKARQFILAIIDVGGQLGAPAILGSMQGRYEGDVSREQARAWLADALEIFGRRAESHGVPFLYEFLNRYETNLCNDVAGSVDLLNSLQSRNVKLLCDLFHMNIEEAHVADALRQAGSRVGHVHYADSNRRAMGMGHSDIKAIIQSLRAIGFDRYLSAEIFPVPDSDAAARQTIDSFRRETTC